MGKGASMAARACDGHKDCRGVCGNGATRCLGYGLMCGVASDFSIRAFYSLGFT